MIVIADTSPINYLILIGEIDLLRALYGRVLIPPSVRHELGSTGAPEPVRVWMVHPPAWLETKAPRGNADPLLSFLDAGERDAILLAEELHADQIVIDEMLGRREARRRKLPCTGTLGILRAAANEGLVDLALAVARLRKTNFHISEDVLNHLLGTPKPVRMPKTDGDT